MRPIQNVTEYEAVRRAVLQAALWRCECPWCQASGDAHEAGSIGRIRPGAPLIDLNADCKRRVERAKRSAS
jgi:hypothetical protein